MDVKSGGGGYACIYIVIHRWNVYTHVVYIIKQDLVSSYLFTCASRTSLFITEL